jgi:hypothetical protein
MNCKICGYRPLTVRAWEIFKNPKGSSLATVNEGNRVRGGKDHLVSRGLVRAAHLANAAVGVARDKFLLDVPTTLHAFC